MSPDTDLSQLSFDLPSLRAAYRQGASVRSVIAEAMRRCAQDRHHAFIHRLSEAELEPHLARLEGLDASSLPLYGVPFVIKDNIDLAGVPTTAACPEFAHTPNASAFVVQRLLDAGIDVIGPTNHTIFKSIYFFDPNGHRLELAFNTGTPEMYKKLDEVKWDMLEEWSKTKRAPKHAAWMHEKEFTAPN